MTAVSASDRFFRRGNSGMFFTASSSTLLPWANKASNSDQEARASPKPAPTDVLATFNFADACALQGL